MRGVWLVIAVGLTGCTTGPKREMRPPTSEELVSPGQGYEVSPDYTRDQAVLQPKQTAPAMNPGPGGPGMGTPGLGGAGPGMGAGGARR